MPTILTGKLFPTPGGASSQRVALNVDEIDDFCRTIASDRPEHVQRWAATSLRSWLIHRYEDIKIVTERAETESASFCLLAETVGADGLDKLEKKRFFVSERELPAEWQRKALKNKEPLVFVLVPGSMKEVTSKRTVLQCLYADHLVLSQRMTLGGEEKRVYRGEVVHVLDYLTTLKDSIGLSWEDAVERTKQNDARRVKQKMQADLHKDVTVVYEKEIEDLGTKSKVRYYIVRLNSLEAARAEGWAMSHCVGDSSHYFQSSALYSLRIRGELRPRATISCWGNNIQQCRGFANKDLDFGEWHIVAEWHKGLEARCEQEEKERREKAKAENKASRSKALDTAIATAVAKAHEEAVSLMGAAPERKSLFGRIGWAEKAWRFKMNAVYERAKAAVEVRKEDDAAIAQRKAQTLLSAKSFLWREDS